MTKVAFKTNETMIKYLIKDLTDLELALFRERIVTMMEVTKQSIQDNPESFTNGLIHPSLYDGLFEKVQKHIGFSN